MLPFLKMLEMMPDTHGIQQAIAKQLRRANDPLEIGKARHPAFIDILANQTSANKEALPEMALDLLGQEAGQTFDEHGVARQTCHCGLNRFQLLRQLFAKLTAQDQKGLSALENENTSSGEKDKSNHWDEVAWCDAVMSMFDPQSIEAVCGPSAPRTTFHEGFVKEVNQEFEKGGMPADQLVASKLPHGMDHHAAEILDAKADSSIDTNKLDGANFQKFSSSMNATEPPGPKGNDKSTNPSDSGPLTGRGLQQDDAFTQTEDIDDGPTNIPTAKPVKPSSPGLTNSDINSVRQSTALDDKTMEKAPDPKSDTPIARQTRKDPSAFMQYSDEQTGQEDKEGKRPMQAEHRFKTIIKEPIKLETSTASIKQPENGSRGSTAGLAPSLTDPEEKQSQFAFAQRTSQANNAVITEKDQPGSMAVKQDDPTVETVTSKSPTDQSDRTISKAGQSDPSGPTKEERVDVIRQIVQRMTLRQVGSQSQMIIRLKPDILGELRVQIITENSHLAVRMTAESSAVKDLIEQNLHHLKSELNLHGLEIQKIDVTVQHDNQDPRQGQNSTGLDQFARRNQGQRKRRQNQQTVFAHQDEALNPVRPSDSSRTTSNSGEVDYFA